MWEFHGLANVLADGIATAEAALRLEQAVYGIDANDERALQALLAHTLGSAYDVAREVHYPDGAAHSKLSSRQRCDLVLTPKGQPLRAGHATPLFAASHLAEVEDALWLEVKVAYQFRVGGRRHAGYGAQWQRGLVDDLRKLQTDTQIRHAAILLVTFNESPDILQKDLALFERVLVRADAPAGFRQVRSVAISDWLGHAMCTVALWPVLK